MTDKIIDILKNGNISIPKILLLNYKKLKIQDNELILLIYLINFNEFNPEKIAQDLSLEIVDVLNIINSLSKKDILKIKSQTINKICEEYICLDELYNKLSLLFMENKETKKTTNNIYDKFEQEFGRTLSPIEYEIIGAWIESGFQEETINLALKEAIYNGVTNLRYIDKILYEWQKKGIKTSKDIINERKKMENKKPKKEVFDYDWLNE